MTDRSPVDLVITADDRFAATANETSNSVSLIRLADGKVVDEVDCGQHPADIAVAANGLILVSCTWSGEVAVMEVVDEKLQNRGNVYVGMDPCGMVVHPKADLAYVGLTASGQVAEIDLNTLSVTRRFDVGSWPKYLTISNDGKRLAVGLSGSR